MTRKDIDNETLTALRGNLPQNLPPTYKEFWDRYGAYVDHLDDYILSFNNSFNQPIKRMNWPNVVADITF